MVWIPGGTFRMGSEDLYPEERPVHSVAVDGFWMDDHQVTVAEFRRFVRATGYVTCAEHARTRRLSRCRPRLLVPGSLVFHDAGPVDLRDYTTGGRGRRGPSGATPRGRGATSTGATATR